MGKTKKEPLPGTPVVPPDITVESTTTLSSDVIETLLSHSNELLFEVPTPGGRVTLIPPDAVMCIEEQSSRTKGLVRIERHGVAHGAGFDGIDISDLGRRYAEAYRRAMLHYTLANTRAEHLGQLIVGLYELIYPKVLDQILDRVEKSMPGQVMTQLERIARDR